MQDVPAAARLLAQQRQRLQHRCAACGKSFEGPRKARYCSAVCRQRAYRQRKQRAARFGCEPGEGRGVR